MVRGEDAQQRRHCVDLRVRINRTYCIFYTFSTHAIEALVKHLEIPDHSSDARDGVSRDTFSTTRQPTSVAFKEAREGMSIKPSTVYLENTNETRSLLLNQSHFTPSRMVFSQRHAADPALSPLIQSIYIIPHLCQSHMYNS